MTLSFAIMSVLDLATAASFAFPFGTFGSPARSMFCCICS
eukprot:CAMPEP_0206503146 /NCGR_PEP_ID=MMETSP0324_2-20121206/54502_1 /ASSEMBLY_ACC=CAM_ASM_000836 /TAXON_ID=2866 /ORGANISM="Crypthecodinium cohnii, Strain Seligo" /LENGTH=39 /DNA_ID= /DNA_START= /DNA_END= /DNA_ORIENTATION=